MSLKVGDKIRDNDTRLRVERVLTIKALLPNGVIAVDSVGRRFSYLLHRIHTDGKPRRSGMSLVTEANP